MLYNLIYHNNSGPQEVILWSAPKAVCYWKKIVLSESTHKLGTFTIKKAI